MKTKWVQKIVLLALLTPSLLYGFDFFDWFSSPKKIVASEITGVALEGRFDKENLVFDLNVKMKAGNDDKPITILTGDIALIADTLGKKGVLENTKKGVYTVRFKEAGDIDFSISFAVKKEQRGAEFGALFKIPEFQVRSVKFNAGQKEVDVKLHSLIEVKKKAAKNGDIIYEGFMKLGPAFALGWKTTVEKLEKELSMFCQSHSVVNIGVGNLKVSSILNYKVVQGSATELTLKVPASHSVTRVVEPFIRDWELTKKADHQLLTVNFKKKMTGSFQLLVEGETDIDAFPAQVKLALVEPLNVIRVSGFLGLGTDSAVKLLVGKTDGLTQVEPASFQAQYRRNFSVFPSRSLFVYNFAALPVKLELTADKVKPVLFADNQLIYSIRETELQLKARLEVEVRDSTIRELDLRIDKNFDVSSVRAADLNGFEKVKVGDEEVLRLYFRNAFIGKKLLDINLEWSHKGWQGGEALPGIKIIGTRTSRGFLSISAEDGLLTDLPETANLRKIPVASLPLRAANMQSAWRFKEDSWKAALSVKRKKTALYSELFHLYSLGENVIYGSVSMTYHISGAPLDLLKIKVPSYCKNVELTGRHRPRLYKLENDEIEVRLQRKISGDYNLLVTFEMSADTHAGQFIAGGVETVGSDSETGYITISGSTGLKASLVESKGNTVRIDPDQVPAAYRLLHTHPVHLAFKYVRVPHSSTVKLKTYESVSLLDQVLEHSQMQTNVNLKGERVTEVNCWLKNSNRQHFVLTLPEGGSLWSVIVDGKKVRCTTQDGQLQVPVPRNADPNKTIHLVLTYAEKGAELSEGAEFSMKSPSYTVPSIYNEWKLNLPGGFSLYEQSGSMEAWRHSQSQSQNQRADILNLVEAFMTRSVNSNGKHAMLFIIALVVFAICWNIGQLRAFGTTCSLILVVWSSFNLVAAKGDYTIAKNQQVSQTAVPVKMQTDFRKTVSAIGEVQKISGFVHDDSVVFTGQSKTKTLYFVGALLLFILACWFRNFIPATAAFALTWLGCVGNIDAEYWFAIMLSLLIPIALAVGLARGISKLSKRFVANKNAVATAAILSLMFLMPSGLDAANKKVLPPVPVYKDVVFAEYSIEASQKTARVTAGIDVKGDVGAKYLLLKSPCAIVSTVYDKETLKLIVQGGNCIFEVLKKCEKRLTLVFDVPLKKSENDYGFVYYMPNSLKNIVKINTQQESQEVTSDQSIYFTKYNEKNKSAATAIFRKGDDISFYWSPKLRKVSEIKPVYYVETKSMAVAAEGHIDLQHVISLQIARGQLKRLLINMPKEQSVTAVKAAGLVNWAFDPKINRLELLLEGKRQERLIILVSAQVHSGDLPYKVSLSLPQVSGAARQHGLIGISSNEGVKVAVNQKNALQGIDPVDFNKRVFSLKMGAEAMMFPFRYFKFPVKLDFQAERVLPEIEVTDHSNFSIGDERLVLNTRLKVNVTKAGVFELKLNIPDKYEIETLTAGGMSHWDEVKTIKSRHVILYFKNRLKGQVLVNAVMLKSTERKSGVIVVPALHFDKEKKHRGELVVSAEQGNRLEVKEKSGIGAMSLVSDGVMTFSILKKDWQISLTREVLEPRVEVNFLQSVKISDNRYNVSLKVKLNVENAGTKFITVNAPADVQNLEIRGRDIAKTEKLSDKQWRIEFKRKILGEQQLHFQYQAYYDPQKKLTISGLTIKEARRQRGYLCLFIPGYMSGTPQPVKGEMQKFEARLLPSNISSSEERKAAFCYRIMKSQWECDMQFVKHTRAEVLQATVKSLSITTMVSRDGRQLHLVNLNIVGGSKSFLKMKLPKGSALSSVFSAGEPLQTAIQDGQYLIPLTQSLSGNSIQNLQITYIQDQKVSWEKASFNGPRFDLPLKEINWYLYVPKDISYENFAGSMRYLPENIFLTNSTGTYLSKNKDRARLSREKAHSLLKEGYSYSSKGRRDLARKTFESVVNLSDSMTDINEDARIQLQTALRRQTLVGLVKRRESLKSNVSGESREFDERRYRDGYFSDSFAKAVEKTLEEEDTAVLSRVSDKIMSQQKAAMQRLLPLRITLPEEGNRLHFYREVQIEPMTEMLVSFNTKKEKLIVKSSDKSSSRNALLFGIFALASFLLFGVNFKFRKEKAVK